MVARTLHPGTAGTGAVASRGRRILIVTAVHIVAIYAVATGLGVVEPPKLVQPMVAEVIYAPRENKPVEPVVPEPQLADPTMEVEVPIPQEVPEIPSEVPVEVAPQNAIS